MALKLFLSLVFIIVALSLLVMYWFVPLSDTEFFIQSKGAEFNPGTISPAVQFYENMRFPEKNISYRIDSCPIKKTEDMKRAFDIVEEKTILNFYEVKSNEEITIFCEGRTKVESGLFIAGEGGPTNITKAGQFNVITNGKILLFKESTCPNPNIAIHELLHVLGFDHVNNSNDIMYEISKCGQEVSQSTIDKIDFLYSIDSLPDLLFEDVGAIMQGRYLDLNISVRNNGLKDSVGGQIVIYADNRSIKEVNLQELKIGHGRFISLTNVWINQVSVDEIKIEIVYPYEELKKENNEVFLKVKK